ncbi:conserved hypothetical protein [Theileria equi strain WA]|uniref:DUF676 domain-containing protein n=1 Tax=Theileria equi strain WA TaxID=1537102 RepID=L1LCA0_THEEQ|nr:conserved hypothetical protein [Theileria equi strain WA]EKX72904.1 conserved hypothetical protein [Theileria equi strain WA]|eukprot:XP_004832356.1 conserved hypothetical protein [Theileria equi strain WA]
MASDREERRMDFCYNCKVHVRSQSCFANEDDAAVEQEDGSNSEPRKSSREAPILNYKKVVALANTFSSKVAEVMNFWGYYGPKGEAFYENVGNYCLTILPDHMSRCRRCHCIFSNKIKCRCAECSGDTTPSHYLIVMHGVLSSPIDMIHVVKTIMERYPKLFIYLPSCVAGKSLLGLNYVLKILSQELRILFSKIPKTVHMSMLGHSFGGVLLRYWHMFYVKGSLHELETPRCYDHVAQISAEDEMFTDAKSGEEFFDVSEADFGGIEVTWKNFITLATPHAGIYENSLGFRKFVSLIGSQTVSELENETVDLLYLLGEYGINSIGKFENVCIYGNISGDYMVAPRTSIILPYWAYPEKVVSFFAKVTEKEPGIPQNVNEMYAEYKANDKEKPCKKSKFGTKEECIEHFINKFYHITAKRINNTKHLSYLQRCTAWDSHENLDNVNILECLKVFSKKDLDNITSVITIIVMNASEDHLNNMDGSDKLLYTEIILSLLYKLGTSRFAVYIPTFHIPHKSIVSNIETPMQNYYTEQILKHVTDNFII